MKFKSTTSCSLKLQNLFQKYKTFSLREDVEKTVDNNCRASFFRRFVYKNPPPPTWRAVEKAWQLAFEFVALIIKYHSDYSLFERFT